MKDIETFKVCIKALSVICWVIGIVFLFMDAYDAAVVCMLSAIFVRM